MTVPQSFHLCQLGWMDYTVGQWAEWTELASKSLGGKPWTKSSESNEMNEQTSWKHCWEAEIGKDHSWLPSCVPKTKLGVIYHGRIIWSQYMQNLKSWIEKWNLKLLFEYYLCHFRWDLGRVWEERGLSPLHRLLCQLEVIGTWLDSCLLILLIQSLGMVFLM